MELSELTAYAEEKYNIREQHKWADFPGFSVLAEPSTGKWVALLMRQWDYDLGEEIQRCDIKCGEQALHGLHVSWISAPFRMKGANWAGVKIERNTQPEAVFRMLDAAVRIERERAKGITIVLDDSRETQGGQGKAYQDTLLPGRDSGSRRNAGNILGRSGGGRSGEIHIPRRNVHHTDRTRQPGSRQEDRTRQPGSRQQPASAAGTGGEAGQDRQRQDRRGHSFADSILGRFTETLRSYFRTAREDPEPSFPQKIHEMLQLFEYGDNSLNWKSRIFVRQARFMEQYEDDAPWEGTFRHYFPVYHDLGIRQLRGYFTWRTRLRKGNYEPVCVSFAYIYLYELLCGIGVRSPEESLEKMKEFEKRFLDAGFGDEGMRRNLRRWMLEFAILHDIPAEEARTFADPAVMERDHSLLVLRNPGNYTDQEVFAAIRMFAGEKFAQSLIVSRDRALAERLFAQVWRTAMTAGNDKDKTDLFTLCFGRQMTFTWHPLANAVYWEEKKQEDREYELNGCRSYICRSGEWQERQFGSLHFDRDRFRGLWHETDRQLRRFLKTGHYLHEKPEEAWAAPFAAAVIEQERKLQEAEAAAKKKAQEEAAKPKITIDLSALDRIRLDAMFTRDSLLTEEETDAPAAERDTEAADASVPEREREAADISVPEREREEADASAPEREREAADASVPEREREEADASVPEREEAASDAPAAESDEAAEIRKPVSGSAAPGRETIPGLDELHSRILYCILRGEDAGALMRENFLTPALAADTINEALFDEIGDNVLECTDDRITLVEDYREDLNRMLQT